jgi:hypothetical protein
MQNFTFVTKHISGTANKVDDALSRKCFLMQEFRVNTLGFDNLNEMYKDDSDFKEAYEASENPILIFRSQWAEHMIQDGLLFWGNQLCIPKFSMRENLLKEKHSGGLAEHFGHDKTFSKLNGSYFWPGMRTYVKKFVDKYDLLEHKREKAEHRVISTITHTRKAMGCNEHGFYIGTAKNTKRT